MTTVIADETLRSILAPLRERAEIKDATGKVLGFFTPVEETSSQEGKKDYSQARRLFDPEEIRRRKVRSRSDAGRSLDQIMERLNGLERGE